MRWIPQSGLRLVARFGAGFALATLFAGYGTAAPGDPRWEFPAGAPIRTTPAIGPEGTVYFGSTTGGLYAVDGGTGVRQWKFASGPLVASPTVGPDGTVYVAERESGVRKQRPRVYAIDPESGTAKWRFTVPDNDGGFLSSPALTRDGVLYVLSDRGWLHALAAETGQELWRLRINDNWRLYSSPVVGADGAIYLGTDRGAFAFEPGTGRERWAYLPETSWDDLGPVGRFVASPALGADGTVYLGSTSGFFFAFNGLSGDVNWWVKPGERITSSAAVGPDGTVYFGSDDGRVYALDGITGEERWHFQTGGAVHSSPALTADGTLYFGSYDHKVYALDAATGAEDWSFATGGKVLGSAAVGADGTVYIGSHDGKLYALEGTGGLAESSWPKFRGQPDNRASGQFSGPPRIVVPPASPFVAADSAVTLGAIVGGDEPMEFQWFFNGEPVEGAAEARLTLPRAGLSDAGAYRLRVGNASGQTEATAELTVGFRLMVGRRTGGRVIVEPDRELYLPGSTVELSAVAEEGREFLGWLGVAEGAANPTTLIMSRHRYVTAGFEIFGGGIVWEFGVESWLSNPAIGPDGTVYFGAGWPDNALYALDGVSGLPRWKFRAGEDVRFRNLLLAPDGTLYARAHNDRVYAIDTASGDEKWHYYGAEDTWPELALGPNGWLYVRSKTYLDALDGAAGERQWRVSLGDKRRQAPSVSRHGTVFVSDGKEPSSLLALDGLTGETRWSFPVPEGRFYRPTIGEDGTVYLGGPGVRALNGASGAERWRVSLGEDGHRSPIIGADGRLFVVAGQAGVAALDREDGQVVWQALADRDLWYDPVLGADGVLYIIDAGERLYALDAASGETRWQQEWPYTNLSEHPMLGPDPILYLRVGWPTRKLLAVQVAAGLADGPWPAPHGDAANTALARHPLRVLAPRWDGAGFSVSVETHAGTTYRLEFKDSLPNAEWTPLTTTVAGDGSRQTLTDTAAASARRFYRLRTEITSPR